VGRRLLERLGFAVVEAGDGLEAVSVFRGDPDRFTCVLLDLAMPAMGGEACLLGLRAVRPDVRVILSSGYHEDDVRTRLREVQPTGFIQKPYVLTALQETLRRVLEPR
jgi:CheY-like chemotaxis protein